MKAKFVCPLCGVTEQPSVHNTVNTRAITESEAALILRLVVSCYGPNWVNTHAA